MQNEVVNNIRAFILGGRSEFTIYQEPAGVNKRSATFKYEVQSAESNPDKPPKSWYVRAEKVGSNEIEYQGYIKRRALDSWLFDFYRSKKSPDVVNEQAINGLVWVLARADKLPDKVHVLHHGKCSVCGRKLTDEVSLMSGIGPTCRKRLGL